MPGPGVHEPPPPVPGAASLPGQPHRHGPLASRLGGPGEAEGLCFCPPAGQGGEKQHSRGTAGTGRGHRPAPGWSGRPQQVGGAAPGEPHGDPLRPVPPPRKPQEGRLGGKEALILLQKTNHSFLVLGSPALSRGRGPARENRAEQVRVLRSGPAGKPAHISRHTPHSSSHFLFPPEPTLHWLRKRRKGTMDFRPRAGHTRGPLCMSQEDTHCSPGD